MDTHKFLQNIDGMKEFASDMLVLELYHEAENIFEEYDDEIRDLKSEIEDLKEKRSEHEDEVHDYIKQIEEMENENRFTVEGIHDNIVTVSILESLFENLDFIPATELESFINKYKPV